MIHNIGLEKVDANMEEATIGSWLVAEGDVIEPGAKLVELITDKVTFEWECPVGGTVRRLLAAPGSLIPIGYVLAQLGDPTEALPDVEATNRALVEEHRRKQEVSIDVSAVAASTNGGERAAGRTRATPAARRLAKEHGIDLANVPTPAGGIVSEDDVRAFLAG